jgi:AraC family ethanolamine operon transcriptional activator
VDYLEALRQRLERSVLDVLVDQIGVRGRRFPSASSRKKIVLRATEYLEAAEGGPVRMAELCRATEVSERTLRYAFQDVLGVSPQRWLQLRRLRAARRALRECDGSRGAVKVAAFDAGFRELGRFSVQYREFFGESPSETVKRRQSQGDAHCERRLGAGSGEDIERGEAGAPRPSQ